MEEQTQKQKQNRRERGGVEIRNNSSKKDEDEVGGGRQGEGVENSSGLDTLTAGDGVEGNSSGLDMYTGREGGGVAHNASRTDGLVVRAHTEGRQAGGWVGK